MWPSIINSLALSAAIILVFILRVLPARIRDRNLYLMVLLMCLIVHLFGGLLMINEVLDLGIYAIFSLSLVVLYGPAFYYYVRKFYGLRTKRYLWHVVTLELSLWAIIYMHYIGVMEVPQWFYNIYYATVLVIYFIATIKLRLSVPLKHGKGWMKTIAIGFGGLIILFLVESIWMTIDFSSIHRILIINTTGYNFFCFLFLLISIRQIITNPEAFSNMKIRIPYQRKKKENSDTELDLILSFVFKEEEYKNPDLSRDVISKTTGISVHRISEIINIEFKKNFNDWVNDYRIKEANFHLINSKLSIKEICYEVGFNSKSAFNNAFKKRLHMTPTEYQDKNGYRTNG
jgi:AraC-like DNA-binding protein